MGAQNHFWRDFLLLSDQAFVEGILCVGENVKILWLPECEPVSL